jgi:hypothetical protein
LRTEEGRLLVGLAGDRVLALSFVDVLWKLDSADSSAGEDPPFSWWGNTPDLGVGCDDSGPLPGVGGRGVSGGESSGAGIEVPSVREKLMGVSVSGWYLSPAMVGVVMDCSGVAMVGGEQLHGGEKTNECRWSAGGRSSGDLCRGPGSDKVVGQVKFCGNTDHCALCHYL